MFRSFTENFCVQRSYSLTSDCRVISMTLIWSNIYCDIYQVVRDSQQEIEMHWNSRLSFPFSWECNRAKSKIPSFAVPSTLNLKLIWSLQNRSYRKCSRGRFIIHFMIPCGLVQAAVSWCCVCLVLSSSDFSMESMSQFGHEHAEL